MNQFIDPLDYLDSIVEPLTEAGFAYDCYSTWRHPAVDIQWGMDAQANQSCLSINGEPIWFSTNIPGRVIVAAAVAALEFNARLERGETVEISELP